MALPDQYSSGNGIISNVIGAQIAANIKTLFGKTLTRPALLKSDGTNLTYVCDVALLPIYGASYQSLTQGQNGALTYAQLPLRNVPISNGDNRLTYAEVGTPVTLTRGANGSFTITGFAVNQPGTYTRTPVNISAFTTGTPANVGLRTVVLSIDQLDQFGTFGLIPFGSYALYSGSTFVRLGS